MVWPQRRPCTARPGPADPPANADVDVHGFTSSTGSNASLPAGGVNPVEPWPVDQAKRKRAETAFH